MIPKRKLPKETKDQLIVEVSLRLQNRFDDPRAAVNYLLELFTVWDLVSMIDILKRDTK